MKRALMGIFALICLYTICPCSYAINENNRYGELLSDEGMNILIELGIVDVTQQEISDFGLEQVKAYFWAYDNGITTMDSFGKANVQGGLTRVAMAKMLSQYAINVLGKKPANVVVPKFGDVSRELDEEYDNGISLSYQLGIMGIGIDKFRPNDAVTRAEFATALSRLLYSTPDGKPNYYSTHLDKLKQEGIITNVDPSLKEMRGYVMLMLMRSDIN